MRQMQFIPIIVPLKKKQNTSHFGVPLLPSFHFPSLIVRSLTYRGCSLQPTSMLAASRRMSLGGLLIILYNVFQMTCSSVTAESCFLYSLGTGVRLKICVAAFLRKCHPKFIYNSFFSSCVLPGANCFPHAAD